MLELREVFQTENYESPFDPDIQGFNDHWWTSGSKRLTEVRTETFVVCDNTGEVARATLDPDCTLRIPVEGLETPRRVIELVFFEVRADRRSRGIGKIAVELLCNRYALQDLIAFSRANQFWRSANWTHLPRQDGDPVHEPALFACLQRP